MATKIIKAVTSTKRHPYGMVVCSGLHGMKHAEVAEMTTRCNLKTELGVFTELSQIIHKFEATSLLFGGVLDSSLRTKTQKLSDKSGFSNLSVRQGTFFEQINNSLDFISTEDSPRDGWFGLVDLSVARGVHPLAVVFPDSAAESGLNSSKDNIVIIPLSDSGAGTQLDSVLLPLGMRDGVDFETSFSKEETPKLSRPNRINGDSVNIDNHDKLLNQINVIIPKYRFDCKVQLISNRTNQWYDLYTDTNVRNAFLYASARQNSAENPLFTGEIGEVFGVRVVVTSNAKSWTSLGQSGGDVYAALFLGKNAYGTTTINGLALRHYFKELGSGGAIDDPLEQIASVGWKAYHTAARLNENFLRRLETQVSA